MTFSSVVYLQVIDSYSIFERYNMFPDTRPGGGLVSAITERACEQRIVQHRSAARNGNYAVVLIYDNTDKIRKSCKEGEGLLSGFS